jgi:hypothetical protein
MVAGEQGGLRNSHEKEAAQKIVEVFEKSSATTSTKLTEFARYMRRQDLTRLLARYEIFKRVLPVKGSIVECGVFHGSGLMSWANFSAILEPTNLMRRIYAFDTFDGFASVAPEDKSSARKTSQGDLRSDSFDELTQLVAAYDLNRPLGHVQKVELIKGDATKTIPAFVESHPHVVVSLLFLDFDLFEPTKIAIETFLPRMPKGAVIAFDELDNPAWPGETLAVIKSIGMKNLRIERVDFDPYIGFAVID